MSPREPVPGDPAAAEPVPSDPVAADPMAVAPVAAETVDPDPVYPDPAPRAAILFAGGRGSRLGGVDKAELRLAGTRLIDRAVTAVRAAGIERIVVVGPEHAVPAGCIGAREEPPFGGPLAALAAGLAALPERDAADPGSSVGSVSGSGSDPGGDSGTVLLLACDLEDPRPAIAQLGREALAAADGSAVDAVVLSDPDGRAQWLAGRYRTGALRAGVAAAGEVANRPLRAALANLAIRFAPAPAAAVADIDTPADLARARAAHPGHSDPGTPPGKDTP